MRTQAKRQVRQAQDECATLCIIHHPCHIPLKYYGPLQANGAGNADQKSLLITRLLEILLPLRFRLILLVISHSSRRSSSTIIRSFNLLAFLSEDLFELGKDGN